jgi:hypothetical protein
MLPFVSRSTQNITESRSVICCTRSSVEEAHTYIRSAHSRFQNLQLSRPRPQLKIRESGSRTTTLLSCITRTKVNDFGRRFPICRPIECYADVTWLSIELGVRKLIAEYPVLGHCLVSVAEWTKKCREENESSISHANNVFERALEEWG